MPSSAVAAVVVDDDGDVYDDAGVDVDIDIEN